jgi:hypothetical protein
MVMEANLRKQMFYTGVRFLVALPISVSAQGAGDSAVPDKAE